MPVIDVTPGIVRNLQKTNYYLRIPHQDPTVGVQHDRRSETITLPPSVNVTLFWKDFDAVEPELDRLDRANIVRIIRRPIHHQGGVIVDQNNVVIVPSAQILNFTGNVSVTNFLGSQADINIPTVPTGTEIPFMATDWAGTNQLTIIPTGSPGLAQIGPHLLSQGTKQLVVSTFKDIGPSRRKDVGLGIVTDGSGFISVYKAPIIPPFSGLVVLSYVVP